eukprot:12201140-Karenia_brevis.AAC.1
MRSRVRGFSCQVTNDEISYFRRNDFMPHRLLESDAERRRCEFCTLEHSIRIWKDKGMLCEICENAICFKCRPLYGVGCEGEIHTLNEHSVMLPRWMECEKYGIRPRTNYIPPNDRYCYQCQIHIWYACY